MTEAEQQHSDYRIPAGMPKQARTRQKDDGPIILSNMEHFVSLARKVKRPELLLLLLEKTSGQTLDPLWAMIAESSGVLPISARNTLFTTVSGFVGHIQDAIERGAERISLLGDEYGNLAVRDVLDPGQPDDAAILADSADKFSRALYLYLRQAFRTGDGIDDRRFDHAESRQEMLRQTQSEKYSSHYLGPKGAQPKLGESVEDALRFRLARLFSPIDPEDIVIDAFAKRNAEQESQLIGLYSLKAKFNGSRVHFQQVAHGEVVDHDEPAVTEVRFAWKPDEGALGVFCDDKEVRPELAAIFRDVVLGGDGDINAMPIREFNLLGFSTPAMLDRIRKDRIDGVENIVIQHIVVAKPQARQLMIGRKAMSRVVSSDFRIRRHRFDHRNIYEIAHEDGKLADLSDYQILNVKLSIGIAKRPHRQAHKVSVEITVPNGFGDRRMTEEDSKLVMAQIERLGCAWQY